MPLRVCIDARITAGEVGGVEQVILGTAAGLGVLHDGDEEYVFLTQDDGDWLKPYLGANSRIVPAPLTGASTSFKAAVAARFPFLKSAWHTITPLLGRRTIPFVNGQAFTDLIQPDLIHFVIQQAFLTSIPSIFSPFDLQHIHLPQNFTPRQIQARELLYRTFCEQAALVVAASYWGKNDLVRHFHLPEAKVQVIPVGNILEHYPQPTADDLERARTRFALPPRYLYFPAQTYPNKNHLMLLEALAQLRDADIVIPLVCSGRLSEFFPQIERKIAALRLENQVRFLGFVSTLEVQCLYRLSAGLVFPTKFEGWGQPVIEAFYAGIPVACSRVTSLPEVAGDAALLFDPNSVDSISQAVRQLWQDDALRQDLAHRGSARARLFTWERTARIFRAHYRQLAGRTLTADDHALLVAPFPANG